MIKRVMESLIEHAYRFALFAAGGVGWLCGIVWGAAATNFDLGEYQARGAMERAIRKEQER